VQDDGITDTLYEITGDEVIASQRVSGSLSHHPRPEELQDLCLAIFGGEAFASNQKLPGKICEYFQIGHADPYLDKVLQYVNCVTASASFSSSQGQLVKLDWQIEAQTRNVLSTVAGNWPVLTLSQQQPFVFRQGTLSIGGVNTRFRQFQLNIDNGIQADDFYNSLTRQEMPASKQTYTLTHETPWDLPSYVTNLGTIKEAAAQLEFVSGSKVLRFEFPRLFGIDEEPGISGMNRINHGFSWKAKWIPGNAINAPVRITVINA
jgi:hypothetical protein